MACSASCSGCSRSVYIRLFHTVAARARSLHLPRGIVLLGGLSLVGLIGMVFPENVSDGYGVIDRALAGELGWRLMAMLALAKVVASSLSLGLRCARRRVRAHPVHRRDGGR
jgi:CIC family chloride channel protein